MWVASPRPMAALARPTFGRGRPVRGCGGLATGTLFMEEQASCRRARDPAMANVDEPLEPDANGDGLCAATIQGKNYSVMHRKSGLDVVGEAWDSPDLRRTSRFFEPGTSVAYSFYSHGSTTSQVTR